MAMPKESSIVIDLPEKELMEVDNETEDEMIEIEIATRSVWRVDLITLPSYRPTKTKCMKDSSRIGKMQILNVIFLR